jgi:hypothetical protein
MGNLFANVPHELTGEEITELLSAPNVRIERIVSMGQAIPLTSGTTRIGPSGCSSLEGQPD